MRNPFTRSTNVHTFTTDIVSQNTLKQDIPIAAFFEESKSIRFWNIRNPDKGKRQKNMN